MPLLFVDGMAFGVFCARTSAPAPKIASAAPKASTRDDPRSIIRVSPTQS